MKNSTSTRSEKPIYSERAKVLDAELIGKKLKNKKAEKIIKNIQQNFPDNYILIFKNKIIIKNNEMEELKMDVCVCF